MRILITGANGFIGRNLVEYMQGKGHDLVCTDRNGDFFLGSNIQFIQGDLLSLRETDLHDVDTVVHLAACTGVVHSIKEPLHVYKNNVESTVHLLELCRLAGVANFINASTGGALAGDTTEIISEQTLPAPTTPYGASKLAVEAFLCAYDCSYGLEACSLRFSNVYGPHSIHKNSVVHLFMKHLLRRDKLVVYGSGEQTRDFVYVKDVCRAIEIVLLERHVGVYQIASGKSHSVKQLIETLRSVVGEDVPFDVLHSPMRKGDITNSAADITRANEMLGWHPHYTLENGLRETWEWYKGIK